MNLKSQIHRISCFPYRHFERSEKSSSHSALSCFLRRSIPIFRITHRTLYRCARKIKGFARDDDTGIALSKHIRCTLREINPFPPIPSFRAQREIFLALCSFLLLSQKVSPFPLSHIRHYPLLQERSLDFARDDDTGIALSKHIRCTLRKINPFPPIPSFRAKLRNIPRTPLFLASFADGFPFSAVSHTTLYQYARKIPRLRSG